MHACLFGTLEYLCEFTKYLLIDYDLIVQKAKVGDGCFRLPWHLLYFSRSDGRSIVLEGPEIRENLVSREEGFTFIRTKKWGA